MGDGFACDAVSGLKGLSWTERWVAGRPGLLAYYETEPPLNPIRAIQVSNCELRSDSGRLLMSLVQPNGISLEFRLTSRDEFDGWLNWLRTRSRSQSQDAAALRDLRVSLDLRELDTSYEGCLKITIDSFEVLITLVQQYSWCTVGCREPVR